MKDKNPRRDAEDELFKRGSRKSRELLKQGRELKRAADRRDWRDRMNEREGRGL